jgi:restriction system protein
MTNAWVIRSGKFGERDSWALANGYSGGGWHELPDLTPYTTRDEVAQVVATTIGGSPGKQQTQTAQVWAMRSRIGSGDLLVMPLKTTKQIAFGRVKSGYIYRSDEPDAEKRHVVEVEWLRTDVPRTAVKQDLLFTLGSALSIFAPSKNHAVARLEAILETGVDPGQVPSIGSGQSSTPTSLPNGSEEVDEPELTTDIQQVAYDQITARIGEDFSGHSLATLVAALLETDGLQCTLSPPGPDGGVDIVAGRGLLGLDDVILVQVKSGGAVGSPVVDQLHGVMAKHGALQGLLVSWGGLSKPAWDALRSNQVRVRVWQAADVVDAVLDNYERLPDEIRSSLQLKRVWMLSDAGF